MPKLVSATGPENSYVSYEDSRAGSTAGCSPRKKRPSGEFTDGSSVPTPIKRIRIEPQSVQTASGSSTSTVKRETCTPDVTMLPSPSSSLKSRAPSYGPEIDVSFSTPRIASGSTTRTVNYQSSSGGVAEPDSSALKQDIRAWRDVRNRIVACQDAYVDGCIDDIGGHLDNLR